MHYKVKNLLCTKCGKSFAWEQSLKKHAAKCGAKPELLCSKCGKQFHTRADLISHEKSHVTPSCCQYCEKTFSRPANLRRHIETVHENKRLICSACSATCRDQSKLREHVLKHHQCKFVKKACLINKIHTLLRAISFLEVIMFPPVHNRCVCKIAQQIIAPLTTDGH